MGSLTTAHTAHYQRPANLSPGCQCPAHSPPSTHHVFICLLHSPLKLQRLLDICRSLALRFSALRRPGSRPESLAACLSGETRAGPRRQRGRASRPACYAQSITVAMLKGVCHGGDVAARERLNSFSASVLNRNGAWLTIEPAPPPRRAISFGLWPQNRLISAPLWYTKRF